MTLKERHHLHFRNRELEGRISKDCESDSKSYLAGYLDRYSYWDIDILDESILKLQQAIAGKFDEIEDPDIGMEFYSIYVTPSGVEVWTETPPFRLGDTFALTDFLELLSDWKNFLMSPPLDGTEIELPPALRNSLTRRITCWLVSMKASCRRLLGHFKR